MIRVFKLKEKIWVYSGPAAWHFITIDKSTSDKIKQIPVLKRGWGSVPVNVTVGNSTWKTSIFPDKGDIYLLPIKKKIRVSENLKEGFLANITLEVIEDSDSETSAI